MKFILVFVACQKLLLLSMKQTHHVALKERTVSTLCIMLIYEFAQLRPPLSHQTTSHHSAWCGTTPHGLGSFSMTTGTEQGPSEKWEKLGIKDWTAQTLLNTVSMKNPFLGLRQRDTAARGQDQNTVLAYRPAASEALRWHSIVTIYGKGYDRQAMGATRLHSGAGDLSFMWTGPSERCPKLQIFHQFVHMVL